MCTSEIAVGEGTYISPDVAELVEITSGGSPNLQLQGESELIFWAQGINICMGSHSLT